MHEEPPSEAPEALAVVARGLTRRYGNNDGVNGLDLAIPRGCKFGLLGPNGAGKSTTLKLMMGMLKPDAGNVTVLGEPSPAGSPMLRAQIGYVPERHHIYRWMTVGEVIGFTSAFYPTWNNDLCAELLGQYGLDLAKKVEQLSHGMTTKLALTLALSHEPELLILDEPTTGLDPIVREEFLEGILHPLVAKTDRTVIFSSHIMSDIEAVSDTIAIINEGRLLVCRAREELMARTKRVVLTLNDDWAVDGVPENALQVQREGDRLILTLHDFDGEQAEQLRARPGVLFLEIHDLSLEAVFKGYVKRDRLLQ